MNIFQKIKLNKILELSNNVISKNYNNYPDYIKNNDDIIRKIILRNPNIIKKEILMKFLIKYPEYINDVLIRLENKQMFVDNPNLIKYVNTESINELIDVLLTNDIDLTFDQFNALDENNKIMLLNNNLYYIKCIDNDVLNKLDNNVQLKAYEQNNELFKYLSFDIKKEIINNNLNMFEELSNYEKLKLIQDNAKYLEYCNDLDIVLEYINYIEKSNEINNKVDKKWLLNFLYNKGYVNYIYSDKLLKEILKNRLNNFPNLFNSLEGIQIVRNDNGIIRKFPLDLKNILLFLNDDILSKNTEKQLINYFKEPSNINFKTLVVNTYGQVALHILSNREKINLDMIEDVRIFDEKIIYSLGENFIKQLLNYKINNLNYFITSILENENLLNRFKYLYYYIVSINGENIESINLAINKFLNLKEIFKTYSFFDLIDKSDMMNYILFDEKYLCNFKSIDQINNYINIRNSEKNYYDISTYTGLNDKDFDSLLSILDKNIDNNRILTNEDLEILQILKKYSNSNDSIKNEIINLIDQYHNKFNPLRIHQIYNKVKKIYTLDFNEEVNNTKNNFLQNAEKSYIDGIEIIDLKGEDFCFLVSGVNGHSMASTFNGQTNSLSPKDLVDNWLKMDNGTSTISTSMLNECCIISEANGRYSDNNNGYSDFFGFDTFEDDQILTFKSFDVGASHYPREIKQNEDICFIQTYKRIKYELYKKNGFNGYLTPKSNETVIRRYNSKGNRILPNFILVYDGDQEQLKRAIEIVKQFKLIGHNIKIYRINRKYYKDKTCDDDIRYNETPRNVTTELTEKVNQIVNGTIGIRK